MATDDPTAGIILNFEDGRHLSVLDLSTFLYDLNLLYTAAYRWDRDTGEFSKKPFWGRYVSKLPIADQLVVRKLRFESPGLADVSGIGAIVLEAISVAIAADLWRLKRTKMKLEIEELRRRLGSEPRTDGSGRRRERVEPHFDEIPFRAPIKRLEANALQPVDVAVRLASPRDRQD